MRVAQLNSIAHKFFSTKLYAYKYNTDVGQNLGIFSWKTSVRQFTVKLKLSEKLMYSENIADYVIVLPPP